jgi:hypothetical protein
MAQRTEFADTRSTGLSIDRLASAKALAPHGRVARSTGLWRILRNIGTRLREMELVAGD